MPARLPVAHVRPLWLRYGAAVALTTLAALLTWAAAPILEHTPFMFFFGAVTLAAYFGGVGPGAFALAASVPVVELALPGPDRVTFVNDAAFVAMAAVIVWLAHRTTGGM